MSRRPTVVFVNTRRPSLEVREAFWAARRAGLDVALVTDKPRRYLEEISVATQVIDTYDVDRVVDAVRDLGRRFSVHGVVTWGDRDVEAVAATTAALDLPGPSPEAARRARNKYEMKQALAGVGDVLPRYALVRTREDLDHALAEIGVPAILKPVGASGSRGINEIRTLQDADRAHELLSQYVRPEVDRMFAAHDAMILEELVEGDEIVVAGWVHRGTATIAGITDTITTVPWHLEAQHMMPSALPPAALAQVIDAAHRILAAIGVDDCAFHIDGKWTGEHYRFFEMAARVSGDYHMSHLVPMATGVDFYAELLRIVTGREPRFEPTHELAAGVHFAFADGAGKLAGVDGIDEALRVPQVEYVSVETATGTDIQPPPAQFTEPKYAGVIGRDPSYEALDAALKQATGLLRMRMAG
jgi:biotin carboxylase